MLDFIKQKRVVLIIVFVAIIFGGIYFRDMNQDFNTIEENQEIMIKENSTKEETSVKEEKKIIVVHIAGCVLKPGVVRLPEGSRIEDAINEAEGLTEDADISNINLAFILEDGMKIKIPSIYDTEIENIEDEIINEINGENISKKLNLVNINTATIEELKSLDGIGSSLANRIIDYRKENGNFNNIDDIKNVEGIGEMKFEKIKDYIKV